MKVLNKKVQLGQNLVFVADNSSRGGHWEGVEVELDVEDHEVLPASAEGVFAMLEDDAKSAPASLKKSIRDAKDTPGDAVKKCIQAVKAMNAHPSQAAWLARRAPKVS